MLLTKEVMVNWNPTTRKWYEEQGYVFTKWSQSFRIKTEHLHPGSTRGVNLQCDTCSGVWNMPYKTYLESIQKHGKSLCSKCRSSTNQKKIEVLHQFSDKARLERMERLKRTISEKNYTLISLGSPEDHDLPIKFVCNKHPECGTQEISPTQIRNKYYCTKCLEERKKNINNFFIQGVKKIDHYLLSVLDNVSFQHMNPNRICEVTGTSVQTKAYRFYSLHDAVNEVFQNVSIPKKKIVHEYSGKELRILKDEVIRIFKEKGRPIYLCDEAYALFQKHFGINEITCEHIEPLKAIMLKQNIMLTDKGVV